MLDSNLVRNEKRYQSISFFLIRLVTDNKYNRYVIVLLGIPTMFE